MYYIADMSGAVMLWEGESLESVTQQVQKLPMVKEVSSPAKSCQSSLIQVMNHCLYSNRRQK